MSSDPDKAAPATVPARKLLVTGGSRGIGAAIASLFAARGWQVALTYRERADTARAVVAEIEADGGTAAAFRVDVSDEAEIVALFDELDRAGFTPDAVVNNAGITGPRTALMDLDGGVLDRVLRTNIAGTMLIAREAAWRMARSRGGKGGAIVNISSTATRLGSPGQWVHYAASKAAVDMFTQGLARELAAEGIRVNAVSPGHTMTTADPAEQARIEARFEGERHSVPLGRIGKAEEVAEAVYWLADDAASYVTGALLPAAGGR
ncbi:SDR family oxidoreductase [Oceanibacterium hippocampi]|nr:SDR family oxidoreductase [Oceanibacterium hippocampi]